MRFRARPTFLFAMFAAMSFGCTFHSTATHWNGRTAPDGRPVWLTTTTTYGVNLLVLLPFVGDTGADALVGEATAAIARRGDHVRVVETEGANYWYAIPPLTWFVAPVMGSVSIEYVPSAQALAEEAAEELVRTAKAAARREADHSHVIPDAKR